MTDVDRYDYNKGVSNQPPLQMSNYFETFFEEKKLGNRIYEVTSPNGTVNFIETNAVIERIKLTKGLEAQKIEEILTIIDYKNGDIHHFLEYLAQEMASDL